MHPDLKLIITRPAYNDMQHIFEYIVQDNLLAASKLVSIFNERFENIIRFPNCGFKPKYTEKNIRVCIVAKHYQIIYSVIDANLYILRILTGYQDICTINNIINL